MIWYGCICLIKVMILFFLLEILMISVVVFMFMICFWKILMSLWIFVCCGLGWMLIFMSIKLCFIKFLVLILMIWIMVMIFLSCFWICLSMWLFLIMMNVMCDKFGFLVLFIVKELMLYLCEVSILEICVSILGIFWMMVDKMCCIVNFLVLSCWSLVLYLLLIWVVRVCDLEYLNVVGLVVVGFVW